MKVRYSFDTEHGHGWCDRTANTVEEMNLEADKLESKIGHKIEVHILDAGTDSIPEEKRSLSIWERLFG